MHLGPMSSFLKVESMRSLGKSFKMTIYIIGHRSAALWASQEWKAATGLKREDTHGLEKSSAGNYPAYG